jgi:hypothetical protein
VCSIKERKQEFLALSTGYRKEALSFGCIIRCCIVNNVLFILSVPRILPLIRRGDYRFSSGGFKLLEVQLRDIRLRW